MTIINDLLTPNPYNFSGVVYAPSRIVIHYTGDLGASAAQLSQFFNNTAKGMFKNSKKQINTSCNYIIGFDGTIIKKAEDNQMTYSVGSKYNPGSIAIEVCYNSKDGKFTDKAIKALSELVPMLQRKYKIENKNVVRHYDLTGKLCPFYYVDNKRWEELKDEITLKNEKENILYRVQVGAFKNKINAENYLKQLQDKGFNGFVVVSYKEGDE